MKNEKENKYLYNPQCMDQFLKEAFINKSSGITEKYMALYSEKIEQKLNKNLYELDHDELLCALPLIGRIYTMEIRRDVSNIIKYMEWAYAAGLRKTPAINKRSIDYSNINLNEVYKHKMLFNENQVEELALYNGANNTVPTVAIYFLLTWMGVSTTEFYNIMKADFIYSQYSIIYKNRIYSMPPSTAKIIQQYLNEKLFYRKGATNGRIYTSEKLESKLLIMPEITGIASRNRVDRGIEKDLDQKAPVRAINRQLLDPYNEKNGTEIDISSIKLSYVFYSVYEECKNKSKEYIQQKLMDLQPIKNQTQVKDFTTDFYRYARLKQEFDLVSNYKKI